MTIVFTQLRKKKKNVAVKSVFNYNNSITLLSYNSVLSKVILSMSYYSFNIIL